MTVEPGPGPTGGMPPADDVVADLPAQAVSETQSREDEPAPSADAVINLRIAVSLSGGGYRAAAFGLGSVMYLADVGLADRISIISSVSGGSITNAFAAKTILVEGEISDPKGVWDRSSALMRTLASKDLLTLSTLARSALSILAALSGLLIYAVLFMFLFTSPNIQRAALLILIIALAVGVSYWAYITLSHHTSDRLLRFISDAIPGRKWSRFQRFAMTMQWLTDVFTKSHSDETLLSPESKGMQLCETNATYRPVFCTTDLASGTHFYISDRFVAGVGPALRGRGSSQPQKGGRAVAKVAGLQFASDATARAADFATQPEMVNLVGAAPDMFISKAVMASAAFPGALQPISVKSNVLGLPRRTGVVPARVRLADGGLYDNLGFTLHKLWHDDLVDSAVIGDLGPNPTCYLVVNSGLPAYRWSRRLGPLKALRRSINVVHQANSRARGEQVREFIDQEGVYGVMVGIGDDPYEIADCASDEAKGVAIRDILRGLAESDPAMSRSWWRAVSQEWNPSVKTTLKRLGADKTARLILHGYFATMARMSSTMGYPLPTSAPTLKEIEGYCVGSD